MGISRKEIGKIINTILYERGIRLMIVVRLNELKKWEDERVSKRQIKYRILFTEITLDRRIRSLFTMTTSVLGIGILIFLIESRGRLKLGLESNIKNLRSVLSLMFVVLTKAKVSTFQIISNIKHISFK